MGVPVIITPQAREDLGSIVRRIARDNPKKARIFGYLLIDKALTISPLPERGRVVPELNDPSVRELIEGSYRVIYEIYHDPAVIYVLRFWHAARGVPQIRPPEF